MPVITVEGPPKSVEQKRKLVELLTEGMKEAYGYPKDFSHIVVVIKENPPENIGSDSKLLIDLKKK
ncbi:MAG: 4-oxalocrotonate tautomerase [Asgard group archaeon]|nr:4-oxalocrotonate tautomerase [Asgard group archaeon]